MAWRFDTEQLEVCVLVGGHTIERWEGPSRSAASDLPRLVRACRRGAARLNESEWGSPAADLLDQLADLFGDAYEAAVLDGIVEPQQEEAA